MSQLPKVIFVLGPPGSGKGTQCQKIVEKFGFVHLSAGDLLRSERSTPGSQYGDLIDQYIREGKIVPVAITCRLLNEAMVKSGKNQFLIDGFPRNQDNLDGWIAEMSNKANVITVLYFDCPEQVCVDRCIQRGAGGSGRTDDNIESLKKRFKVFFEDSMPIINIYEQKGMVIKADGQQAPNEVFESICQLLEPKLSEIC